MKAIQLSFRITVLCCCSFFTAAQSQQATLITPEVKVVVNNNGALFTDGQQGQFIAPYAPGQLEISTLGAAGLWLGGIDPGGNLKLAAQLYDTGANSDFVPGVIDPNSFDPVLTGIYRVTREEIQAHLNDFFDNGVIDNPQPGVFGWPGRGNPFFSQYHGFSLPFTPQALAGFYDRNSNGLYNPDAGDYPSLEIRGCPLILVPAEMLWFAFNDMNPNGHPVSGGSAFQIEVQCQMFSFDCDPGDPLNRTVFTRYKMINRGLEPQDSTYFGLFTDFNIGNPNDDFFGCDTSRSLVFGYNGDAVDEGFYGAFPPVMAVKMFRGPLNENGEETPVSVVVPVDTGAINNPVDYYNLLTGNLPGGAPGPVGGIAFPGNPWEQGSNSEIGQGSIPGNRAVLSAYGPFNLYPGAVNEFIAGFYFNTDIDQSTAFENLLNSSDLLQYFFDGCFNNSSNNCNAVLDASLVQVLEPLVKIYPNPAQDDVLYIESEAPFSQIYLRAIDGRLIRLFSDEEQSSIRKINISDIIPGIYFLELRSDNGRAQFGKIVRQ